MKPGATVLPLASIRIRVSACARRPMAVIRSPSMPRSARNQGLPLPSTIRPAVTVDVAVVTREQVPQVLLIRRKHDPFAGMWALPGGFVEMDEPLEAAARREFKEETGVDVGEIEQLGTFGDPGRDPRGRTI